MGTGTPISLAYGARHFEYIAKSKFNLGLFFVSILVATMIIMFLLLSFGLSMLIGVTFLVFAGLTLLLGRGSKYPDEMVILFVIIGVAFIILNYMGIDLAVIDVSQLEIAQRFYTIIH